ncbi:hypothetical protein ACS0TY_013153 [Phlomoides rotata]
MQNLGILHQKALFNFMFDFGNPVVFRNSFPGRGTINSGELKAICQTGSPTVSIKQNSALKSSKTKSMLDENVQELSNVEDDDDGVCPVDCVREFYTDEELSVIMEKANEVNALVVVDFYRTSCGSCKYIEQGFSKLCKGAGDQDSQVIFLKHNVLDEYDEQSEVAERLRIKSVPLFHFYKNGALLEAFATRDKERILAAILKYTGSAPQQVDSVS